MCEMNLNIEQCIVITVSPLLVWMGNMKSVFKAFEELSHPLFWTMRGRLVGMKKRLLLSNFTNGLMWLRILKEHGISYLWFSEIL